MTPERTALTLAGLLQAAKFALMSIPANLELGAGETLSPRDRTRLGGTLIFGRDAVFRLFPSAVGMTGLSFSILFVFLAPSFEPSVLSLLLYLGGAVLVCLCLHICSGYFCVRNYGKTDLVAALRELLGMKAADLHQLIKQDRSGRV